jgi:hypothetical protein
MSPLDACRIGGRCRRFVFSAPVVSCPGRQARVWHPALGSAPSLTTLGAVTTRSVALDPRRSPGLAGVSGCLFVTVSIRSRCVRDRRRPRGIAEEPRSPACCSSGAACTIPRKGGERDGRKLPLGRRARVDHPLLVQRAQSVLRHDVQSVRHRLRRVRRDDVRQVRRDGVASARDALLAHVEGR